VKKILLILLLFFSLMCSACSSWSKWLAKGPVERPPLDENAPVTYFFASSYPVIPESSVYLATLEKSFSTITASDYVINYLIKEARTLGANFIYIKQSFSTTGIVPGKILVDFYYSETWLQNKIMESETLKKEQR
jgi:hypothetical protein